VKYLIPFVVVWAVGLNAADISIVDGTYDGINPAARIFRVYYDSSHSVSDPTMPIVVFIHGGAWAGGSLGAGLGRPDAIAPGICSDTLTALCDLASRGYAVYSIDYTLTAGGAPENKWPAQWQDCECFLKFLAEQAGVTVPGNPQHILMMGHSAGAHLAAITTLAPHDAFPTNCTHTSVNYAIDGVVAASLPDDLVAVYAASVVGPNQIASGAITNLLGCRPVSLDPECILKARAASPTNYVAPDQPSVLVLSGMGDTTIPYQSQGLLQAAYATLSHPVFSPWIIYGENYNHDLDLFYYNPCSSAPSPEPSPCGTTGAAYRDILAFVQGLPSVNAVTNGASFAPGVVVPGEIATIFGNNLMSARGINLTSGLPLPNQFLNVVVTVNGIPAPLFAVDNVNGLQQVNFQVPWEVANQSVATVEVLTGGIVSSSTRVPVVAAQPGIFGSVVGGQTFGAILHANYQHANSANPVVAGEIVLIYCTGLGAVASPPADGVPGDKQMTLALPSVTIGGLQAQVSFSGLPQYFVGLYQVNAQVPDGIPSGNQPVVVTIGGFSSPAVLVPVQ
jgi:uncharacterized protein (TIGR03437 family)